MAFSSPSNCSSFLSPDFRILKLSSLSQRLNFNQIHHDERRTSALGRRSMLIDGRFWKNQSSSSSSTAATKSSFKCFSQRQSIEQKPDKPPPPEEEFEFERLFSNLNQATLKREPGNYYSSTLSLSGN